jgi:large subunit ribosomal protein L9
VGYHVHRFAAKEDWVSMDVILTSDVLDLGEAGEIKSVADGYARNYLIPRGLAILATASARKQITEIESKADKRRSRERDAAERLADRISGVPLTFDVRVGEGDRLYGSITSADIAKALEEATGEDIDRRRIVLHRPIKTLGDHPVPIRLAKDLTPEVIVSVQRDEESQAEATVVREDASEAAIEEPLAAEDAAEETE